MFSFDNPNRFGADVPDIKNDTTLIDPADPDSGLRKKKWYEWASPSHDRGYWLPDGTDPTQPQRVTLPNWYSDKVPTTGRDSALVNDDVGISVISVQDWNQLQNSGEWKVVTEEDLQNWGVIP